MPPEIELGYQSANHADHRPVLIGAPGQNSQQKHPKQRAIGDRRNLQSDFDHAPYLDADASIASANSTSAHPTVARRARPHALAFVCARAEERR